MSVLALAIVVASCSGGATEGEPISQSPASGQGVLGAGASAMLDEYPVVEYATVAADSVAALDAVRPDADIGEPESFVRCCLQADGSIVAAYVKRYTRPFGREFGDAFVGWAYSQVHTEHTRWRCSGQVLFEISPEDLFAPGNERSGAGGGDVVTCPWGTWLSGGNPRLQPGEHYASAHFRMFPTGANKDFIVVSLFRAESDPGTVVIEMQKWFETGDRTAISSQPTGQDIR
jgi:hypothetical protein